MLEWYILHCQSQKEKTTAELLESVLGLTTYLPQVQQWHQGKIRLMPLFPRYLFLQMDRNRVHPATIVTMPGVVRIVSFDHQPQPIPADIVENLRQRVVAINHSGCLLDHGLRPGDNVRFKKGPLYGLEAVFQETLHPYERVRVLIEFMGRINRVDVAVGDLERVAPQQHPPRRTRGKGRKIVPKKTLCEDTVQL